MSKAIAVLSTIAFLGFHWYFAEKAFAKYRKKIAKEESTISQNNLAALYGVIEPWKTKYCWAGFVQIILIALLVIYL